MGTYRKKPVEIQAEQFFRDRLPWPEGVVEDPFKVRGPGIETLEGRMDVRDGDWVITGLQGERYPCKPDIFESTYEPVVEVWAD